jgi:hypothetical protein
MPKPAPSRRRWTSSRPTRNASRSRCARACRAFCGGLAGYFGYDTVRHIEKKLETTCPPDTLGCPDILLLQCEELAVIDNLSGKLYLIVYADPGAERGLHRTRKPAPARRSRSSSSIRSARRWSRPRQSLSGRARLCQGRLPAPPSSAPRGTDRGGRFHAGAGGPAHQEALHRVAAVAVPCAAFAQSQPVHVLLPLRGFPRGGRVAGDPGAAGADRRGPEDHDPPAGRHPAARRHAGAGQG